MRWPRSVASRAKLRFGAVASRLSGVAPGGIVRSMAALGGAVIVSRSLTVVTLAYCGRALGREGFGLLSFGTAVTAYATILIGPGLLIWGTRAIAREPSRAGSYLLLIKALQLVLATVAFGVVFVVASATLVGAERTMAVVAGLAVFAVASSTDWASHGLQRYGISGAAQILASSVTLASTLSFVRSPADVRLVPLLVGAGQISGAVYIVWALNNRGLLSLTGLTRADARHVVRAALPLGTASVMITLLHFTPSIAVQLGHGSAAAGIFGASYRLVELLTFVPGLVSSLFLPRLSSLLTRDADKVRAETRLYVRIVMSLAVLPATVFAVDATAIVGVIYGPDFDAAAPLLVPLSAAVVFNFAAVAYLTGLLVMGRDRAYFASILAALFVSMFGSLTLVPVAGAWGATATVAALDLVTWLAALYWYRQAFGSVFLDEWLVPIAAGLCVAFLILLAQRLGVPHLARWTIGAGVYATLVAGRFLADGVRRVPTVAHAR